MIILIWTEINISTCLEISKKVVDSSLLLRKRKCIRKYDLAEAHGNEPYLILFFLSREWATYQRCPYFEAYITSVFRENCNCCSEITSKTCCQLWKLTCLSVVCPFNLSGSAKVSTTFAHVFSCKCYVHKTLHHQINLHNVDWKSFPTIDDLVLRMYHSTQVQPLRSPQSHIPKSISADLCCFVRVRGVRRQNISMIFIARPNDS